MESINQIENNTFFIHDYETFGKNPALDKPSQFSGIRTDLNFNPVETKKTFFCSLPNDYLPTPESVLLTEIDPMHALYTGLKENEFARHIQKSFNTPKTCILGYNNIRFDNEFSRHIFYRNFYDPYSWSWKNENSNWDLLHAVKAFHVLRPEGIQWPLNKKGFPSFRLQDLTKSNHITHDKIHDASSDVYATLELAKLLKYTQPKLFNYLYYYRTKKKLKELINLKTMKPLLYIPVNTFQNNSHIIWISPIAWHPNNSNILIVCNLNENLEILWKPNIKLFKNQLLTPYDRKQPKKILKQIHMNKCPILIPINSLRPSDISRLNINTEYCLKNFYKLKKIISNNNIQNVINATILSDFKNNHDYTIKNIKHNYINVDNQLYKGFFNQSDQDSITIIRNSSPESLSKLHIHFFDERLQPLLFHYRARNFPNTLHNNEKNHWRKYKQTLFTQTKLTNYAKQLDELLHIYRNNEKKYQLLKSLTKYLNYISTSLNN